jgi:hypothetical protein
LVFDVADVDTDVHDLKDPDDALLKPVLVGGRLLMVIPCGRRLGRLGHGSMLQIPLVDVEWGGGSKLDEGAGEARKDYGNVSNSNGVSEKEENLRLMGEATTPELSMHFGLGTAPTSVKGCQREGKELTLSSGRVAR